MCLVVNLSPEALWKRKICLEHQGCVVNLTWNYKFLPLDHNVAGIRSAIFLNCLRRKGVVMPMAVIGGAKGNVKMWLRSIVSIMRTCIRRGFIGCGYRDWRKVGKGKAPEENGNLTSKTPCLNNNFTEPWSERRENVAKKALQVTPFHHLGAMKKPPCKNGSPVIKKKSHKKMDSH